MRAFTASKTSVGAVSGRPEVNGGCGGFAVAKGVAQHLVVYHRRETNRKVKSAMKLTSTQIEQTLGQFEAEPIPEDHPMVPQLNEVFGEHTYFVSSDGLIILEPAGSGLAGVQSAKVVNLGEWSDDAPSALELHEPETTDLVVTLGFRH
jgi:hypothetical protein